MLKEVTVRNREPLKDPKFIKTSMLSCERDGKPFMWEMVNSLPTVHILVAKTDSKELLLVKQIRPPVLYNRNAHKGECIEACAGMLDKYETPEHSEYSQTYLVAKEEVHEELGYDATDMIRLAPILSSVGSSGNKQHLFYAEVTDASYVGQALEPTEDIEVIKIPYTDVRSFINTTSNTDATTKMLMQWWLINKGNR